MKNIGSFIFRVLCLSCLMIPITVQATDFVDVGEADVLIITHTELRTPGWTPGMIGAWETELLAQKELRGYSVALLEIQDGIDQFFIRDYLETKQGSFQFIYILGDARRPENDPPEPLTISFSDFSDGNIVPIWREVVEVYWERDNGLAIVESDLGYLQDIPGVYAGRIPVESSQEILDYLSKSSFYLSLQGQSPSWSKNILEAINDVTRFYNGCSGPYVQAFFEAWENEFPPGWPVTILANSTGPVTEEERAALLENHLNSIHYGLMNVIGTNSGSEHLSDWYFGNSPYNFTNFEYLPFMLGLNCDMGGFDQYNGEVERECVIEKMVLHPDGGIIAAIAHTGATVLSGNCVHAIRFFDVIFSESCINFGQILNRSIEVATGTVPIADFTLKMLVLLGDPTLSLPYGPFSQGHWTKDISPVIINEDITIEAGTELIIDPGVEVRFADGVNLIVEGTLTCLGTGAENVKMLKQDGAVSWGGIDVHQNGIANINYCEILHAVDGITGLEGSRISLNKCEISNSLTSGVTCTYPARVIISNTRFLDNNLYAISVVNAEDRAEFYDNRIEGNHNDGIKYLGGTIGRAQPEIKGNTMSDGSGVGIWVERDQPDDMPQPQIGKNTISNFDLGIVLFDTHEGTHIGPNVVCDHNRSWGLILERGYADIIGEHGDPNSFSFNHEGIWGVDNAGQVRLTRFEHNIWGGELVNSYLDFGTEDYKGENSFEGNSEIFLAVYDSPKVSAQLNWWGTTDPDEIEENIIGDVIWEPFLEEPPDYGKVSPDVLNLPDKLQLSQSYPNPFNITARINFDVPKQTLVSIKIYNILGQEIRELYHQETQPGTYSVIWDGKNNFGNVVSSGVYLYSLKTPEEIQTKKMVLLK